MWDNYFTKCEKKLFILKVRNAMTQHQYLGILFPPTPQGWEGGSGLVTRGQSPGNSSGSRSFGERCESTSDPLIAKACYNLSEACNDTVGKRKRR